MLKRFHEAAVYFSDNPKGRFEICHFLISYGSCYHKRNVGSYAMSGYLALDFRLHPYTLPVAFLSIPFLALYGFEAILFALFFITFIKIF